ncbi:MAG TPA: phenylalanine--tRNA ligase subunit alpha [Candidatus Babeliales bacterium]|nr:phenylalanine--tRNA ligase subunit alpha [Candidatus Babeliales bacterium]
MNSLQAAINEFKNAFSQALSAAKDSSALETVRINFLGRKGKISELMDALKTLSIEEKRTFGPLLNELKQWAENSFTSQHDALTHQAQKAELAKQKNFDITATIGSSPAGSLHPMTHIKQRVENIFISMGYQIIDGPEVDNEYFNFEALNIPENHPARDMWDTFWLDVPGLLLRTHTSSVQARTLANNKPPFAAIVPGRTYRHEATDATHDFQFMQVEGVVIDRGISMSNLIATCKAFLQEMFGSKELSLRIRPSYFPFTEPSIEIDISCPFCTDGCSVCKYSRWIESGGAGLVHPRVLKTAGIDSDEYSGFAFGFGLTRLAMLMYGINDIRLLHSGKIEFLEQFS